MNWIFEMLTISFREIPIHYIGNKMSENHIDEERPLGIFLSNIFHLE